LGPRRPGDIRSRRQEAGDYLFGPRDIPHRFDVGDEGCQMQFILTPGGIEALIRATSEPAGSRRLPPSAGAAARLRKAQACRGTVRLRTPGLRAANRRPGSGGGRAGHRLQHADRVSALCQRDAVAPVVRDLRTRGGALAGAISYAPARPTQAVPLMASTETGLLG
jgi:hypothetical protein